MQKIIAVIIPPIIAPYIANTYFANPELGRQYIENLWGTAYGRNLDGSEHTIEEKVLVTNGRSGEITDKKTEVNNRVIKIFKFNKVNVIYNFTNEQYFSPVRKDRIVIRGTRGETENCKVRYYNKNNEFVENEIKTIMSGLLDGLFCDKIVFEDKVLYTFPHRPARLSEEESAIAACLLGMDSYIKTGKELYSYKRGYEDYSFFNV